MNLFKMFKNRAHFIGCLGCLFIDLGSVAVVDTNLEAPFAECIGDERKYDQDFEKLRVLNAMSTKKNISDALEGLEGENLAPEAENKKLLSATAAGGALKDDQEFFDIDDEVSKDEATKAMVPAAALETKAEEEVVDRGAIQMLPQSSRRNAGRGGSGSWFGKFAKPFAAVLLGGLWQGASGQVAADCNTINFVRDLGNGATLQLINEMIDDNQIYFFAKFSDSKLDSYLSCHEGALGRSAKVDNNGSFGFAKDNDNHLRFIFDSISNTDFDQLDTACKNGDSNFFDEQGRVIAVCKPASPGPSSGATQAGMGAGHKARDPKPDPKPAEEETESKKTPPLAEPKTPKQVLLSNLHKYFDLPPLFWNFFGFSVGLTSDGYPFVNFYGDTSYPEAKYDFHCFGEQVRLVGNMDSRDPTAIFNTSGLSGLMGLCEGNEEGRDVTIMYKDGRVDFVPIVEQDTEETDISKLLVFAGGALILNECYKKLFMRSGRKVKCLSPANASTSKVLSEGKSEEMVEGDEELIDTELPLIEETRLTKALKYCEESFTFLSRYLKKPIMGLIIGGMAKGVGIPTLLKGLELAVDNPGMGVGTLIGTAALAFQEKEGLLAAAKNGVAAITNWLPGSQPGQTTPASAAAANQKATGAQQGGKKVETPTGEGNPENPEHEKLVPENASPQNAGVLVAAEATPAASGPAPAPEGQHPAPNTAVPAAENPEAEVLPVEESPGVAPEPKTEEQKAGPDSEDGSKNVKLADPTLLDPVDQKMEYLPNLNDLNDLLGRMFRVDIKSAFKWILKSIDGIPIDDLLFSVFKFVDGFIKLIKGFLPIN